MTFPVMKVLEMEGGNPLFFCYMYCTFLQAIEKHSKSLIFHLKVTSLHSADVMLCIIVDQALLSHRLRVDSIGYQSR